MKLLTLCLFIISATAAGVPSLHAAGSLGWNADSLTLELAKDGRLPPLPEGVAELSFAHFFKTPVGERGLEFSDTLLQMNGRRVRILGYMVKQTRPSPGIAILAPFNFTTNEAEYSLADDIPPAVVFVEVPEYADIAVPHTRGPLLLTGTLEVGRREERDGRVSLVRLRLDPK